MIPCVGYLGKVKDCFLVHASVFSLWLDHGIYYVIS